MNRLVMPLMIAGLMLVASYASACNACGNRSCCTTTQTCCQTTYRLVTDCQTVTRMKKVTCVDECGRCYTKCVPYRVNVTTCRRVPVTTCRTVTVPVQPCCAPASVAACCPAPACDPCARRPGLLERIRSKLGSRCGMGSVCCN